MTLKFEINDVNLTGMDSGLLDRSTDSHFALYVRVGQEERLIYRSESVTKTLNPHFEPFTVNVGVLTWPSPLSAEIKLVMFDKDMMTANDPLYIYIIGDLTFKVDDHLDRREMLFLNNVKGKGAPFRIVDLKKNFSDI